MSIEDAVRNLADALDEGSRKISQGYSPIHVHEDIAMKIDALIVARIEVAKGCKVPGCQCPDA